MRTIAFTAAVMLLCGAAAFAQSGKTPCTLVTKEDVQAITGKTVTSVEPEKLNATVCHFKTDAMPTATMSLAKVDSSNNPAKMMEGMKKSKYQLEEVKGLGDVAFFAKAYGMFPITVYKGSHVITANVFIPTKSEAERKAMAEKLARKALAGL